MRSPLDTRYQTQRRTPRERYAEMGRKGGIAKARRVEVACAPTVRAVIDRSYLRRAAIDAYARALSDFHAACAVAEDAYWRKETAAIRRALRLVAAANALADRYHDELLTFSTG